MAFDITTTAQNVQTHLKNSNLLFSADIARPNTPLPQGPSANIYPESMRVVGTTLTTTIELHTLRVEVSISPTARNQQERVLEAARIVSVLLDYIYGDFTLGDTVRNVDIGGQYGGGIEVEFTEQETASTPYHVANITLPLIVDGATAFAA